LSFCKEYKNNIRIKCLLNSKVDWSIFEIRPQFPGNFPNRLNVKIVSKYLELQWKANLKNLIHYVLDEMKKKKLFTHNLKSPMQGSFVVSFSSKYAHEENKWHNKKTFLHQPVAQQLHPCWVFSKSRLVKGVTGW